MEVRFALHKPVMPLLRRMFAQTGALNVVDLCSGRGELVLELYEALTSEGIDVEFTVTDKCPDLVAFRYISSQHPLKLHYVTGSVDATKVPPELVGLRTIFNAFHRFPPRAARRVLEDAVKAGQPICIFEIPERRLLTIISLLLTPLFVAFATPFHKTVPMEAIAMDLLDSTGPSHVLLGRRNLPTSGLHHSRAI